MNEADAVIIGAGHNGLVAANLLADAGWQVAVLETAAQPGGAVRTAEFVKPGYLSDLCSSFYPLGVASRPLLRLGLAEYGLRWTHAPDVLAHLLPDGRAAVLSRDPARTARSAEAFASGDGRRWLNTYQEWLRLSPHLADALLGPFPPMRSGARLLGKLRAAGAIRMARRVIQPVQALAAELFVGEGAQLLLTGCALHTDLSPHDAGGAMYGWLLAMLGQQYGFPVPEGGAGSLTQALTARLRAKGGLLLCGAAVEHIEVSHGTAVAVRTAGGQRWRARRAVLADVPAPALYLDLLDPNLLPARLREDLDHFRWDGSTVKVDWALSAPVPWQNEAVAGAGTVHLGADMRGLTRYAADLSCGDIPRQPLLITGQMTTSDPTRSPRGTEAMWAYTHLPHRTDWPSELVAEHAARIEDTIEKQAPGFKKAIAGRHISGPADLQAENPSLVGGALGGGTSAAYQQLFLRPIPGLGRADTPIARLFLASSSAHPGGGVHGSPGANAAKAALAADRHLTGAIYRAAMKAAQRAVYRDGAPSAREPLSQLPR